MSKRKFMDEDDEERSHSNKRLSPLLPLDNNKLSFSRELPYDQTLQIVVTDGNGREPDTTFKVHWKVLREQHGGFFDTLYESQCTQMNLICWRGHILFRHYLEMLYTDDVPRDLPLTFVFGLWAIANQYGLRRYINTALTTCLMDQCADCSNEMWTSGCLSSLNEVAMVHPLLLSLVPGSKRKSHALAIFFSEIHLQHCRCIMNNLHRLVTYKEQKAYYTKHLRPWRSYIFCDAHPLAICRPDEKCDRKCDGKSDGKERELKQNDVNSTNKLSNIAFLQHHLACPKHALYYSKCYPDKTILNLTLTALAKAAAELETRKGNGNTVESYDTLMALCEIEDDPILQKITLAPATQYPWIMQVMLLPRWTQNKWIWPTKDLRRWQSFLVGLKQQSDLSEIRTIWREQSVSATFIQGFIRALTRELVEFPCLALQAIDFGIEWDLWFSEDPNVKKEKVDVPLLLLQHSAFQKGVIPSHLVTRWFRTITEYMVRKGILKQCDALRVDAIQIRTFLQRLNPEPSVWKSYLKLYLDNKAKLSNEWFEQYLIGRDELLLKLMNDKDVNCVASTITQTQVRAETLKIAAKRKGDLIAVVVPFTQTRDEKRAKKPVEYGWVLGILMDNPDISTAIGATSTTTGATSTAVGATSTAVGATSTAVGATSTAVGATSTGEFSVMVQFIGFRASCLLQKDWAWREFCLDENLSLKQKTWFLPEEDDDEQSVGYNFEQDDLFLFMNGNGPAKMPLVLRL